MVLRQQLSREAGTHLSNLTASLPPKVPRWLSIIRAFRFVQNPIPILNENLIRYGETYTFHIGGIKPGIVTTEPDIIQHVLQKNHRNYRKSDIQSVTLAHYVGKGLLTAEGDYWLRQRRLIQPGFHRSRLATLISLMQEEIATFIDEMLQQIKEQPIVDVYKAMHVLAFKIIGKALFSTGLDHQTLERLSLQITEIQSFIIRVVRQPYARMWFRISGQNRKYELMSQEVKAIIREIIEDRLKQNKSHNDLLQMMIDARYEDTGKGMSLEQLLDECLILFIAGHETSANALAWSLYLLAKHPDYQERIFKEGESHLSPHMTLEDTRKLMTTTQVIGEALRLYPPAWVIDRVAKEDDEIAGYQIPRGALVVLYVYGAHHNPRYWQKPEKFDPTRFDTSHGDQTASYRYFPFGGGPRLCIGNHFAMLEMQLVLSNLLQSFSIDPFGDPDQAPELLPLITLRPKGGIKLRFHQRERRFS